MEWTAGVGDSPQDAAGCRHGEPRWGLSGGPRLERAGHAIPDADLSWDGDEVNR